MTIQDSLAAHTPPAHADDLYEDEGPGIGLLDLLTWLGDGKRLIATATLAAAAIGLGVALLLPVKYTARTTFLAPGSQQQSGSSAALAALGSLGGLAGGLSAKTPDDLYVALLKSDSVDRALAARFDLMTRYEAKNYEALRKAIPGFIRVSSDKKSGVISVEVDDEDAKFAATLANAHADEVAKVLARLAVSEAQLRRAFFEKQLSDTKENLIKAEVAMQRLQETSGVIVLDKQAEALIAGAATVRAMIAEREVQLKVMRTGATSQNPDVMRLGSELAALRSELTRMESNKSSGNPGSAIDLPVGKIPEAGVAYVRALRELKLQETLLESMIRQFEIAKLDEAKEGPSLQQVDVAVPPDYKSKPSRALVVLGSAAAAFMLASLIVVVRRYSVWSREQDPEAGAQWQSLRRAWRLRG